MKYRIKQIIKKNGSSEFFVQYRRLGFWDMYYDEGFCLIQLAQNEIKKLKGKEIQKIILH